MIKTLLMVYYAKLSNVTPETHTLPTHAKKMFHLDLRSPYGVYILTEGQTGEMGQFRTENSTSVKIHTSGRTVVGVTIILGGFPMMLLFHGDPRKFGIQKNHAYRRPKNLIFFKGEDVYLLSMAFPNWNGEDIWFSHGDQNAVPPTDK